MTTTTATAIPACAPNTRSVAAAGASGYVHAQASASATWTINHGLGYRPAVELLSAGGAEMIGEVVHPSTIQTLVYFVTPRTGSARLT